VAPERSTRRVGPKVKRAKSARKAKSDTQSTSTERQQQQDAIPVDMTLTPTVKGEDKLARIKKAATKNRLEKAFENLKKRVAGADHEFNTVAYKFVLGRVSNRMWDSKGECANTEQDVANNILFELHEKLTRDPDSVRSIYGYLANAAYKQGSRALTENNDDRDMHEPLMVEVGGDDRDSGGEETYMQDNPLIHLNELRPIFRRELPAFIQGDNLRICEYIRENYTYERIAEILCMTLAAVKQRVVWMRRTIEKMRAADKSSLQEVN
jgi:hypothetical protein